MALAKENIGFLYINGLNDGTTTPKDRIVERWWQRAGLTIVHTHLNWKDGGTLESKLKQVAHQVDEMLTRFDGVAIIGSSAGGSLALNSYARMKDKNVCAVISHGRLRAGDYKKTAKNSLYRRAGLHKTNSSQAFFDSVIMAETKTIPKLSEPDKRHLLVLTQLTDLVVPMECMGIDGVQNHRSIAFGHSGGFVAHFLNDRDIINRFAQSSLATV